MENLTRFGEESIMKIRELCNYLLLQKAVAYFKCTLRTEMTANKPQRK